MLSLRYPENQQLTTWSRLLSGGPKDPGFLDWSDVLNMTTTLMTMIKQYSEVHQQAVC